MATDTAQLPSTVWISAAVLGVFLLLRLRTLGRDWGQAKTLNLGTLWVSPLLYVVLAAMVIAVQPPQGWEWLWLVAGAGLGGALGWWRGKTMEIMVHSVTGALSVRTSPAAALFLIALLALRYVLRFLFMSQAGTLHLTVQLITGTFVALALGLLVMQRVEMTLRAIRLVGRASTAGATAAAPEPASAGMPAMSAEAAPAAAAASAVRAGLSTAQLAMLAAAVFIVIVIAGLAMPR